MKKVHIFKKFPWFGRKDFVYFHFDEVHFISESRVGHDKMVVEGTSGGSVKTPIFGEHHPH